MTAQVATAQLLATVCACADGEAAPQFDFSQRSVATRIPLAGSAGVLTIV